MSSSDVKQKKRHAWTWLLLPGVLLLLLAVLGLSTYDRLQRTRELMVQSLTQHGQLMLQYLESATRASMRQGVWRLFLLQVLSEELVDQQPVRSIVILGPQGEVLAAASSEAEPQTPGSRRTEDLLAGLDESQRQEVAQRRPITGFVGNELLVGRPFEPLRRFLRMGRAMPSWVCPPGSEAGPPREGPPPPPGEGPPPPLGEGPPHQPGEGLHHPPLGGHRQGMMMGQAWLQGQGIPLGPEGKPYALVRLSTASFAEARNKDIKQALLLAGLIFLAAGVVSAGAMAAARHRGRELERLRKEVAESEHLAAVGRLAGSVAHEVRNPLSALRGLVQFLAKGQEQGSKQAEYAQVAVEEVDRLERVVSGLLEYTRPRPPRLFPLDVEESLRSTLELMRDDPRAQGVILEVRVEATLPVVKADPDQLRQVLVNLVVNSLEALNGRGALSLTARPGKGRVVVEVADDGPGLPPGDPEQLFDPFFSTRERGTGLGLAIARRIVQAHGGELKAANRPQGGAQFTFTLPLSEAGA